MTFKEFVESRPLGPGMFKLLRGSHNNNQEPAIGIYFNGIHYTTDPNTAQEFGDVHEFVVRLKNPKFYNSAPPRINPTIATKQLLKQGFDSVIIKHRKPYIRYERDKTDHSEILEIPDHYDEYEVIVLKNM